MVTVHHQSIQFCFAMRLPLNVAGAELKEKSFKVFSQNVRQCQAVQIDLSTATELHHNNLRNGKVFH